MLVVCWSENGSELQWFCISPQNDDFAKNRPICAGFSKLRQERDSDQRVSAGSVNGSQSPARAALTEDKFGVESKPGFPQQGQKLFFKSALCMMRCLISNVCLHNGYLRCAYAEGSASLPASQTADPLLSSKAMNLLSDRELLRRESLPRAMLKGCEHDWKYPQWLRSQPSTSWRCRTNTCKDVLVADPKLS